MPHFEKTKRPKYSKLMKRLLVVLLPLLIGLKTTCNAQQYGWVDISSNLPVSAHNKGLSALYFINDYEGWICTSDSNVIYHTSDGGSTFTTQSTLYYTKAIYMLNDTLGYAGGYGGYVFRTTNGGSTWTSIGSIGKTLTSISFPLSSTTGYCCGYSGKVYSITSSTLTAMNSGLTATNLASISFQGTQGWACGEQVIDHYSSSSWVLDQSYPDATYNSIHMINSTTGWAAGDNGVIIKTTDGTNWVAQTSNTTSSLYNLFFLDTNNGWAVGLNGTIIHTTNGGSTWAVEGSGLTINILRSVQFTSPTNGYVIGNNGTLLKYTGNATGVNDNEKRENLIVFPNPNNGIVRLNLQNTEIINSILVYNLQGQKIMQTYCSKDNTLDLSGLTKGIYILNIETTEKIYRQKIIKK